jgi:hypothetical protein
VAALPAPVQGKREVLDIIQKSFTRWWRDYAWHPATINGAWGVVLMESGKVVSTLSFAYDGEERIVGIYVVRNPDKLHRFASTAAQPQPTKEHHV